MNGIGWVCDECGKTEVQQGKMPPLLGALPTPPTGWFLLYKGTAPNQRWEFCSVECVHKQSAPQPSEGTSGRLKVTL